jgi:3-methyl-2-oxobutanoate hydroxymethyltransferase
MDEDFSPKFVKKYLNLHGEITRAVENYTNDVKSGRFPSEEHSFHRDLTLMKRSGAL